jgi:hypothetical protein
MAGAYEYTAADLAAWDAEGPGSTFKRYDAPYEALAHRDGLPPEAKPWCYDTRRHTINRVALDNASVWSLKREAVEADIRQRQEQW